MNKDGWTAIPLGNTTVYAAVNYHGNVIITNDVGPDGTRKELVPDLEYNLVVVV